MKTFPKTSLAFVSLLGLACLTGLMSARAQETSTPSTDSLVAIAADSQSLPQIPPAAAPLRGATYWWVYPGGVAVPTPCLPLDPTATIYGMTSQEFLVDLAGGAIMVTPYQLKQEAQTTNAYAAAVTSQVQRLINLITWIQTPTTSTTTTTTGAKTMKASPMGGGGGPLDPMYQSGVPYLTIAPTGTNGVFLITVWNNQGPANYEIWYTPVLGDSNYPWTGVAAGTGGQTNFTVSVQYPTGFYRAVWDTNSIPLWEAADPNNPGAGVLTVFIDSPTNGAVLQ